MRGLSSLEDLARALKDTPGEARFAERLKEMVKLLHRKPPSPERDALLALAYLRLYQALGREEDLLRGYSYARTARLEAVRNLAEKLLEGT